MSEHTSPFPLEGEGRRLAAQTGGMTTMPYTPLALAKEMAFHLRYGAWAQDDATLVALAKLCGPGLDQNGWQAAVTHDEVELVRRLLEKAADSDWSWEVPMISGIAVSKFAKALEQFNATEAAD